MSCEIERNAWIAADRDLIEAVSHQKECDDVVADLETQLSAAKDDAVAAEVSKQEAAFAADGAYSAYIACVTG